MKKLLIVIIILLILSSLVFAKLSDETLEEVEKLRWKHYPIYAYELSDEWTWTQSYPCISWEDGILYVETQDGKWYIEMKKIE